MLAKKYKLTRKDISFLYKKQKFISGKYFLFLYYPQYKNKHYNQIAINIPLKFSKKSSFRNKVKRILYDFIRINKYHSKSLCGSFWKIFIFLNKKSIDNFVKIFNKNDKDIILYFQKDLQYFEKKLCLHNSNNKGKKNF